MSTPFDTLPVVIPVKENKVNFPAEYMANPNGYYELLITSVVVEKNSQTNVPKLTLEVLPLCAYELDNRYNKKDIKLKHSGRFPVRFVMDLNYYNPPSKSGASKKNMFVEAITGGNSIYHYINMFRNIIGKQVTIKLEKRLSAMGKEYYIVADIKRQEERDYLPLPIGYNPDDNNTVIQKGMSEGENWINQIPKEEWNDTVKNSLLPDSDYIYLIPRDGANGVNTWFSNKKEGTEGVINKDEYIKFNYNYQDIKSLRLFSINRFSTTEHEVGKYPDDLEKRLQEFKDLGLKPVSKDWIWGIITSGQTNAYNQVDNYFKENMPKLYFKKEFTK